MNARLKCAINLFMLGCFMVIAFIFNFTWLMAISVFYAFYVGSIINDLGHNALIDMYTKK